MPTKPKKHKPQAAANATPNLKRPSTHAMGYTKRWSKLSRWHRQRHPLCADPYGWHVGKIVPAEQVDHVVPLTMGGTNEASNLVSLCRSCHSRKTVLMDGGFGNQRAADDDPRRKTSGDAKRRQDW